MVMYIHITNMYLNSEICSSHVNSAGKRFVRT
jgi:hypothetical protein